jgi:hypothetical protein
MARGERLQVLLTPLEQQWLRWWAAQVGRTPASAAARLLSERIEEVANRPSNLLAFGEDQARAEPPAEVLSDIALACMTEGVVGALQGDQTITAPAPRQAAVYLERVSTWLEGRARGHPMTAPPRLSECAPESAVRRECAAALALWRRDRDRGEPGVLPPGTLEVSDKRQLSDTAMGLSQTGDKQVRQAGGTRV